MLSVGAVSINDLIEMGRMQEEMYPGCMWIGV
jgi:hypothetical protein